VCPIIASVMSRSQDVAPAGFNKVAASLFRRAHAAGRFGPFPLPKLCIIDGGLGSIPECFVDSCLRCVNDASSAAASSNPLFEFVGQYGASGPTHNLTCDVIKCHSHTLRRLTVPMFAAREAVALACAVADCRVIETLDLTRTGVPFRSSGHH
jgi:hypothetical protein